MAKCPYNRKTEITVVQNNHKYNEDQLNTSTEQITKTSIELMDCLKENCGAYYNNRCNYYTAVNEKNT